MCNCNKIVLLVFEIHSQKRPKRTKKANFGLFSLNSNTFLRLRTKISTVILNNIGALYMQWHGILRLGFANKSSPKVTKNGKF